MGSVVHECVRGVKKKNGKCAREEGAKMFHMCWAPSDGSSKLMPIDEQPNHQIVHLFRLGKA